MALGTVVDDALARAADEMTIDYDLHVIVTDPEVPHFEADLVRAAEQGSSASRSISHTIVCASTVDVVST